VTAQATEGKSERGHRRHGPRHRHRHRGTNGAFRPRRSLERGHARLPPLEIRPNDVLRVFHAGVGGPAAALNWRLRPAVRSNYSGERSQVGTAL